MFDLTEGVKRDILFAMEDQTTKYLFDAKAMCLVPLHEEDTRSADGERYYDLPEWSSADGYGLLEAFTQQVRSPLAREELRQTLVGGRGVFRNFKNVLRAYPLVDRQWHYFKHNRMTERLYEWYNVLRESWGLESLSEEIEDEEGLFESDFEFDTYEKEHDEEFLVRIRNLLEDEYVIQYGESLGLSLAALCNNAKNVAEESSAFGFICRTQSDENAGCILCSPFIKPDKKTVLITDFFVLQNYRGLGLGKELLLRTLAAAKERGVQFVLAASAVVPKNMELMLCQNGFEKLGSGFVATL